MRLHILAVGVARGTPEGSLTDDYIGRAKAIGKRAGFTNVEVVEVPVSKLRESRSRIREEGERLAARIPQGAHAIFLDAKGKGMTSEDFAEALAALRDAGARDLVFLIGGPDGLDPGPAVKASRSLAFGPQIWPHLLVRAMLAEQVYRAFTILSGHPYHRA
ncbi:MAG: 23S rRNA (pseudouridine(1915)-N(3))-methyltransferase RlmH [Alphaproteobacteria bacterium]|nr:23S rRNA (pseudouridine(1915)-N(3))-methyltransferase RlmH [Alphaproteobacteria bacterium]